MDINIAIMRAFVHLRKMISSHAKLARKLEEIEKHLEAHDRQILDIFEAIRALVQPPEKPRKKIGFQIKERRAAYGKRTKRN